MQVVISHAHDEAELAQAWKDLLTSTFGNGIDVWYSSDLSASGGMQPGQWREQLTVQLRDSEALIAIQTPASAGRPWIVWECGAAIGLTNQRIFFPVFYGMDADGLPSPLTGDQSYPGQSRQDVRRVCELLAAASKVQLTESSLNRALDAYERAVSTHPSIVNAPSIREVQESRRKSREFCDRVAGWWYERIKRDGIGFFPVAHRRSIQFRPHHERPLF